MASLARLYRLCPLAVILLVTAPLIAQTENERVLLSVSYITGSGDGIPGHYGFIEAGSFAAGITSQPLTFKGQPTPNFPRITVTKALDTYSPHLRRAAVIGDHLPDVEIKLLRAGFTCLKITLRDAIITEMTLSTERSAVGSQETISFDYNQIFVIYTVQNPDGSAGATVSFGWDRVINMPL